MAKQPQPNIFYWLALLIIGFGIVGFVALAVQQNYRLSANDPQIQMAEDTAADLQQGKAPTSLVPANIVNVRQSLAPFEIIVDKQLNVLATNASNPGLPPHGVFTDAATKGELRFTWQTADGLRYATVVTPAGNDFVVTARSLREVEKRETRLQLLMLLAWICIIGVITAAYVLSLKPPLRKP